MLAEKKESIVRLAQKEDFTALLALRKKFALFEARLDRNIDYSRPVKDRIEKELALSLEGGNNDIYFVCTAGGDLSGYLRLSFYPDFSGTGFLGEIFVREKFRNQQIATLLVEGAEKLLKERRYKKIRAMVSKKNNPAIRFFKKFSFRQTKPTTLIFEKELS